MEQFLVQIMTDLRQIVSKINEVNNKGKYIPSKNSRSFRCVDAEERSSNMGVLYYMQELKEFAAQDDSLSKKIEKLCPDFFEDV